MELIWWAVIIGVLLGGITSAIFGIYSKKSVLSYSRNIFGFQSGNIISDIIILLIAASFIFLTTVSFMIRDLAYPASMPLHFTIETLLMAFLPSCIIFIMTLFRGYSITGSTIEEFGILAVKFGVLHLLLQFSGVYSYLFPPL
jgi:hypothetical protein